MQGSKRLQSRDGGGGGAPPAGVTSYVQPGIRGGGTDGGADGGGAEGGAEGSWQEPSQSNMYSTYTKLPSYAFSSTAGVVVVTSVYVPSGLEGSGTILAHSKKPRSSTTAPSVVKLALSGRRPNGLHLPCTSIPLTVVLTTYSSAAS